MYCEPWLRKWGGNRVVLVVVVVAIKRCNPPSYRTVFTYTKSFKETPLFQTCLTHLTLRNRYSRISRFYSLLAVFFSGSNSLRIAPFDPSILGSWSFSVVHCEGRPLCSNHRNICAQDRAVSTHPLRQIPCVAVRLYSVTLHKAL